jgi:hypothetical protein
LQQEVRKKIKYLFIDKTSADVTNPQTKITNTNQTVYRSSNIKIYYI